MKKRIQKVAFLSGTRADFGLMVPILKAIEQSSRLSLVSYATGMHLMPTFGKSITLVKKDFPNTKIVKATFKGDDLESMAEFCSELLPKITAALKHDQPDFVLVLGDRPEMLTIALASLYLGIPIGHVHGGDVTFTIDGVARHAITKLAAVHFPATSHAAKRIERLGEEKWRIHTVGAPTIEVIKTMNFPSRKQLFDGLGIPYYRGNFILLILHPYYQGSISIERQITETLEGVKKLTMPVIALYPNADPGGRKIIKILQKQKGNSLFHTLQNLEHRRFLSLMREAGAIVGNSSSALIEAPSFGTPVLNIGPRERDRQRGENVIDVGYDGKQITKVLRKVLLQGTKRKKNKFHKNPWGDGNTGKKVVKILENLIINEKLLTKRITY